MTNAVRGATFFLLLALFILPTFSLAQDDTDEDSGLVIVGTRSGTELLSELLEASEIDLDVSIDLTGSDPGIEMLCNGTAQIVGTNSPMSVEQEAVCIQNGVEYLELLLGYEATAFITHPDNTFLDCLADESLNTLFAPSAQDVVIDWAQTGFPVLESIPLSIFLPAQNTATYAFLDGLVSGFGLRADVTIIDSEEALIAAVASTPGSIGITNLSNVDESVNTVAVRNNALFQCFEPSSETLATNQYPLASELLAYAVVDTLDNDNVVDWLDYIFSDETIDNFSTFGFSAPDSSAVERNRAVLVGTEEPGRQFSRDLVAFQIPTNIAGNIAIGGSPAASSFLANTISQFTAIYSSVTIEPTYAGQTAGIRRFCSGELDMVVINRALTDEELTGCENNTINPLTVNLGGQIVVMVGNAEDTTPACLTTDQIVELWGSNEITTPSIWSNILGDDNTTDITLVAPPLGFSSESDLLLNPVEGPAIPRRADVDETNGSPSYRAEAVSLVPGAITYMTWQEYLDVTEENGPDSIKLIAVDAGNGCVAPSTETVAPQAEDQYPFVEFAELLISQRALSRSEVQSLAWFLFQDQNFVSYERSSLSGLDFGELENIRETLQENFEEAIAAGLEPLPTSASTLRDLPPLGDGLPFDIFDTSASDEAMDDE